MTMAAPNEHVDRRYEDRQVTELPDAPVDALRGLGKAGGEALRKAIGVKTIRDLADNQFVLAAQEIVRAAEAPAGAAAVAEVAVAAGAVGDAGGGEDDQAAEAGSGPMGGPSGDQELTRSEEELSVGTERVGRGRAGVRKRVVTDQVDRTVPVEREELRVEREPIAEGDREGGTADAELSGDERTVELHEERPVVEKRVVPRERVRVGKDVVTDEERVSEEVRREEIDVDDPGEGR
jgi:uncharacterized protein (TIGR02271 family)